MDDDTGVRCALLLCGPHAGPGPRARRAIVEACTAWRWTRATPESLCAGSSTWRGFVQADVVVCPADGGLIAGVAAAGVPAVVVAGDSPEERRLRSDLHAAGAGPVLDGWPDAEHWPGVLGLARALGAEGWTRWLCGAGAEHHGDAWLDLGDDLPADAWVPPQRGRTAVPALT